MYLDASVIVAILGREADAEALIARLEAADTPLVVSPPGMFEAVLGLAAKKARAARREPDAETITRAEASVRQFVTDLGAEEMSVTPEIGRTAIEVAKRYSRAVGSPAALNFGDCFAYACARSRDVPVLYKGNDFAQTDLA
ncbi:MAG TPA: type II toxin-antitoxin system VapC family toxin [Bosea sp. (in: a-proteobacteria)]|jgi:ribonuclease VapC|nr:type II toxin-antitoxin system VapC family toxin [Bosea sp. (in: a-proteobacteria)]